MKKSIVEAALLTAGEPLSFERLRDLFAESSQEERPSTSQLRELLTQLAADYENRGVILKEIASGFCFQANPEIAPHLKRLWQERPPRYSRALMETLAIIAYRQPVTRGEIEEIRGVCVSSNIVKTLLDQEWVRVIGQKEVPGKPSLYGTTKQFLDHFNLKNLEELPAIDFAAATLLEEKIESEELVTIPVAEDISSDVAA